MRTIELKAYEFKELSDEAKEKVLERYRNWNVDDAYWYEPTTDYWKEKLEEIGFSDAEIQFSGFWSQGDGACFNGNVDAETFAKTHGYNAAEIELVQISDPQYKIVTVNHHYCHYNTRDVQFDCFYGPHPDDVEELRKVIEAPREELPLLIGSLEEPEAVSLLETRIKSGTDIRPNFFTELEEGMEAAREELSKEIYRDMEKEYYYQTSDEVIIESLEDNNMEFDEDGDTIK